MKHLFLLFLTCLGLTTLSKAQIATPTGPADPTHWKYYMVKVSENTYEFHAAVTIDRGWHIFATDPGGDGLLIPTSIIFNNEGKIITESGSEMQGKLIRAKIEGFGGVNYYQDEARIVAKIKTNKPIEKLTGTITYQSCNDRMCLPPVDLNFVTAVK